MSAYVSRMVRTKTPKRTAKLIMIWWGLFAFIGIGLEHSIANMTLLALGIFLHMHPQMT